MFFRSNSSASLVEGIPYYTPWLIDTDSTTSGSTRSRSRSRSANRASVDRCLTEGRPAETISAPIPSEEPSAPGPSQPSTSRSESHIIPKKRSRHVLEAAAREATDTVTVASLLEPSVDISPHKKSHSQRKKSKKSRRGRSGVDASDKDSVRRSKRNKTTGSCASSR